MKNSLFSVKGTSRTLIALTELHLTLDIQTLQNIVIVVIVKGRGLKPKTVISQMINYSYIYIFFHLYRIVYFGGYGIPPDPHKVDESCGFFTFNTSVEDQFTVSFQCQTYFQGEVFSRMIISTTNQRFYNVIMKLWQAL